MAIINSFSIGQNEIKRFRIFRGNVEEVTQAAALQCTGTALQVNGKNALGEIVSAGSAFEFSELCDGYPGAIIHTVTGSLIWSQPQPLSYAIVKNNVPLVLGSINKSTTDGGDSEPDPPADPNFGGETPVENPDAPGPPSAPPSLPSGNGNPGFGSISGGGSQLGITGGNT